MRVDEMPKLVKPGVEISMPGALLDRHNKEEVWVTTTTSLVKARHQYTDQSPSLPPTYYDAAVDAG